MIKNFRDQFSVLMINMKIVQCLHQITEDMTAPLSDYYIFASHNTYLTGNQLTSKCSTEPIVKALLSGCRVIEIDCWNGPNGTIKVTHGK